ncbi:N-acetylmuramoyl-L-alanine amidase [Yersinia ruckeri]|uniref:N-acetylmuramoyl-L-alanine amidase n=1 Tax=Yersinia ruckeri TaxID=29486 RepID=UPI001F1E49B7|nr:N-acetylmuramoyl-L-alanine amidase [Yersinia ruckeri]MCW6592864.1 N-acetylmuramoyl-L-alanine amidase [Yersinia ruckeri]UIN15646.1 N-acetylmuramoyl-L-alanine amidase [Yersinia ruckeri]UIN19022.1 N-acetylmuramoyl-L-alanine amidase [Yersinia ruckeri]
MENAQVINIDYNSYRSVKGFNKRVRFLILHYTVVDFVGAITVLTGSTVSSHYLIPDPTDPGYIAAGFDGLRIFNLVDENDRAWHAGISHWHDRTNLNDSSIGIELVNQAIDNKGSFTFPPYSDEQIEALKDLAFNILQRYPDITPTHVLAHSDISLGRKSDPGAAFPWYELYMCGIGAWYDDETKDKYELKFSKCIPPKSEVLHLFKTYGYDVSHAESDLGLEILVRGFQLHFRPECYDGIIDSETMAILAALVEKYFHQ